MRLLLDTHALLWWLTDDDRLSPAARRTIQETANDIFVSAASAWEISTKQRLGKLTQVPQASSRFDELVMTEGFAHLAITHRHAMRAGNCDSPHRDPFDRMLAAQGELKSLVLITRDPAFEQFGSRTLW